VVHLSGSEVGLAIPEQHRHRFDATTRRRLD
jgi:hypothetical protein